MPLTDDQRATLRAITDTGKVGDADRGRIAAWLRTPADLTVSERNAISAVLAIPRVTDAREPARSMADARATLLASPEAMRALNTAAAREGLDGLSYARERLTHKRADT